MSTILVTGAAGDLGKRATRLLAALPAVERVLAVDIVPVAVAVPELEAHALDLAQPGAAEELAALGKRATAVVHLAWRADGPGNLTALQNVLAAAAAIEPGQFVHLSSATVYGAWADNPVPITEEVQPRPNPELAYAVEKRAAELVVEGWARDHPEVAVAVLRPACTIGPVLHPLYRALASSKRPLAGSEGRVVQYLHVDDLAGAVVHTVDRALSGVFNVAADAGIREEQAGALSGRAPAMALGQHVAANVGTWRWRLWHRDAPSGVRAYAEHSWAVAGDRLHQTGWKAEYTSEQALVVSDDRRHWDELPQARRVSVVLASAGAAIIAAGAGGAFWWRRKH